MNRFLIGTWLHADSAGGRNGRHHETESAHVRR
jgi:hypothetical protein